LDGAVAGKGPRCSQEGNRIYDQDIRVAWGIIKKGISIDFAATAIQTYLTALGPIDSYLISRADRVDDQMRD
jgi:hypothetical protein